MAELIGNILKYFKFEEIDIDNWVFKLYYQASFGIFLLGSMIGVMSQYFGKPIACDFLGVDRSMAAEYCWIHGSSYIPKQYRIICVAVSIWQVKYSDNITQKHRILQKISHAYTRLIIFSFILGIRRERDAPDTSYYQWVTFVLLFQAGCFLLPFKVWLTRYLTCWIISLNI